MKFDNKFLQDINIKFGDIFIDSFEINPSLPLEGQELAFREDLIHITFGKGNGVDVGWYPSIKPYGFFTIIVVCNYDWENPIYKKQCKSLEEMKKYLQEAIDIADKMYRSQYENK